MNENFDTVYDRKPFNSIKWRKNPYGCSDFIPMGIADMDIPTPDFVLEAMRKRLEHPFLGYFNPDDSLYTAILNWRRVNFGETELTREEIICQNSVLGGVAAGIQLLTEPGDAILVQTPGYSNFAQVAGGLERKMVFNPLVWDGEQYMLDLEDFEKKITDCHVKLYLHCSPHNPTGRVWSREELTALAKICERHGIPVISDEIWSDLVLEGSHIPFRTVTDWAGEHTISMYGPSKTFNIAGISIAYAIVKNSSLRERFRKVGDNTHYNTPNLLSVEALTAAYENGRQWKQELCEYLKANTRRAAGFFREQYPDILVPDPQGTYLLWLDFQRMGLGAGELLERFGKEGLYFNDGRSCIAGGEYCLRMNAAMPRPQLEEVLERFSKVL